MTNGPDIEAGGAQRRPIARRLLLLPPAFLVAAACVLVGVAPYAWGAGEVIDLPAWMPTAIGLLVASGGLLVGGYSLRKTLRETHGDFEVFGLQTVAGIIMFMSGGLMMLSVASELPDTANYRSMIDDDDEVGISPLGFFVVSLALAAFNIAWVWVGAYLYGHAFSNQEPNRISRRTPGEVDGVGALLRERR
jgi:hypothetical protein